MSDLDTIPPVPDLPWDYDATKPSWSHGENGLAAICHPDAQYRFHWQGYTRYFEGGDEVPIDIVMADWREDNPEAVVERMYRVFHPEVLRDSDEYF